MPAHPVKTLVLAAWIALAVAAVTLLVAARIVTVRARRRGAPDGGATAPARRLDRWAVVAGGLAIVAQTALRLLPE